MLVTILLIDDDFTTNYLHKKIITKAEFDSPIEVANNGKEGIDKLLAYNDSITDEDATVLIFLDLNMPIVDGWQFLDIYEEIKPKLHYKTNLFIISSSINQDDYDRAKSNNLVDDYIPKLLTVDRLKSLKENFIKIE